MTEEFVGCRSPEGMYDGERQYCMWLTEEPIVRCRDCKHHDTRNPTWPTCYVFGSSWHNDDFCSHGERR